MSIERENINRIRKWSAATMTTCLAIAMSCAPQPSEPQTTERAAFRKAPERSSALNGILALQAQSLLLADTLRNLPGSRVETGKFVQKTWTPGPFGLTEINFYNPVTNTEVAIDYSTLQVDSSRQPELVDCDSWQAGGYGEYYYIRIQTFSPSEAAYLTGAGTSAATVDFNCMGGLETVDVSHKNGYASSSSDSSNVGGIVRAAQSLYTISASLPK